MPWDTKTKGCLCQIWLHCWSRVSRLQRYSAIQCVCIWVVSGSGRQVCEMWPILDVDLPNAAGKHRNDFLEPPSPCTLLALFSKELSCCVTMEINDYCWNALIIVENNCRLINYTDKLLCFFCLFSFPLLGWRRERPRISGGLRRRVAVTSSEQTIKETLWRPSRAWNIPGHRKDRGWRKGEGAHDSSSNQEHNNQ